MSLPPLCYRVSCFPHVAELPMFSSSAHALGGMLPVQAASKPPVFSLLYSLMFLVPALFCSLLILGMNKQRFDRRGQQALPAREQSCHSVGMGFCWGLSWPAFLSPPGHKEALLSPGGPSPQVSSSPALPLISPMPSHLAPAELRMLALMSDKGKCYNTVS